MRRIRWLLRAADVAPPLILAALVAPPLAALDSLRFEVAALEGAGFSTGAIDVRIGLAADGAMSLDAAASALALPPPLDRFRSAALRCAMARWTATALRCDDAVLRVSDRDGEVFRLRASARLLQAQRRLEVKVPQQTVGEGRLGFELALGVDRRRARARFSGLDLAPLGTLVAGLGVLLPVTIAEGALDGDIDFDQRGSRLRLDGRLSARGVAYSDDGGLRAGEGLDLELAVKARGDASGTDIELEAALSAGAVYEDPLLLEVADDPVTANLTARLEGSAELTVSRFSLVDPQGARAQGSARLNIAEGQLQELDLRIPVVPLERLYGRYLEAFTGAGALAGLELAGAVDAEARVRGGRLSAARIGVRDVALGSAEGRFALYGLEGTLHWHDSAEVPASTLSWSGAEAYALDLGPGQLTGALLGRSLRLLEPTSLAVVDGRLRLERLEMTGIGTEAQALDADLALEPVSLERLSNRLAWLPLSGSVSGRFPALRYADGRLAVNGDVAMRLFDGDVTVSGLVLENPFGVVPRLRADVELQGLDLAILTRALSFGSIEGRLDGYVRELVLEEWQPVTFDASLYTPPGDTSRRRISQRAVDNLASLGGANAVLSSTFLRFFQEFSYERLGLRCRLRAGVCDMAGVEPAPRGYYIVKGGGLPPRVNVVGFNARVDWDTLVQRLRAVAGSQGPVIR